MPVHLRANELDIIARDQDGTVVFVEVRSRSVSLPGSPEETVSQRKQRALTRAATHWLVAQGLWEQVPVRFDVVAVDLVEAGGPIDARELLEVGDSCLSDAGELGQRSPGAGDEGLDLAPMQIRWYRHAFEVKR